jgi:6-phosphofructokinase 1
MHTPAGAFGSCRYKLKGLEENRAQYERLIDVFRAHDIGYFFYNGGNDSADTCLKVSQISERLGYPLIAVHVPKTVDNDLAVTDNCPGFRLRREIRRDVDARGGIRRRLDGEDLDQGLRARGDGRHAGWITAAVGMAEDPGHADPPHAAVPGNRVRRGQVPRGGGRQGKALRVLLRRRVGGSEERRRAR